MSFDSTFTKWLDESVPSDIPAGVRGFSFNLTEVMPGEFEVELIGAERFDRDDEDWACEEIWEPAGRSIEIPSGEAGNGWEDVLERMAGMAMDYLSKGARSGTLKSADGIGIGFVDGNLKILWLPNQ